MLLRALFIINFLNLNILFLDFFILVLILFLIDLISKFYFLNLHSAFSFIHLRIYFLIINVLNLIFYIVVFCFKILLNLINWFLIFRFPVWVIVFYRLLKYSTFLKTNSNHFYILMFLFHVLILLQHFQSFSLIRAIHLFIFVDLVFLIVKHLFIICAFFSIAF